MNRIMLHTRISLNKGKGDKMDELTIYKQALNNSTLVIITNYEGNITYVNEHYCNALGYNADEIIGKNPRIFNSGFHPKSFFEEMRSTISQGKTWRGKIKNITKDGNYVWMDTIIYPFYPDDSLKFNYLVIRHNVLDQIEDLKSREQFLSNISHEIRTPLHGITNIIDILSKTSLDNEQSYYLSTIQSASESLLHLLNDVLDFYKIEFQKLTLEETSFNLISIINSVISLNEPISRAKNTPIKLIADKDIPTNLEGDSNRVRQIISNLLDNALKYTDEGEIEISIKLISIDKDKARININIKDTGIGISESKKEIIFQKYKQANNSDSRLHGGTGLGLHIVKELISLMGGKISLESTIGVGSTFMIDFILKISENVSKNISAESTERALEPMSILIIDDSEINRLVLKKQMDTLGYDYSFAKNGLEGLQILKSIKFELILLDIQMPIMDGIGFLNELDQNIDYSAYKSIPIIIVSAGNKFYLQEQYPQINIKGNIHKPFKINDIQNKIDSAINQKSTFSTNRTANELSDDGIITRLNYLTELADGDVDFMRELISSFILKTPECIEQIKTNFKNNLPAEVVKTVHKFTPQMTIFGIEKHVNILYYIEKNVENPKLKEQVALQIDAIELILNKAVDELKNLNI